MDLGEKGRELYDRITRSESPFSEYSGRTTHASGGWGRIILAGRPTGIVGSMVAIKIPLEDYPEEKALSAVDVWESELENARKIARSASLLRAAPIIHAVPKEDFDPSYWIIMEFVKGSPLSERITHRTWGLHKALSLMQKVASAVIELNGIGVNLLDISGNNIIVLPDDSAVKLIDPAACLPQVAIPPEWRSLQPADILAFGIRDIQKAQVYMLNQLMRIISAIPIVNNNVDNIDGSSMLYDFNDQDDCTESEDKENSLQAPLLAFIDRVARTKEWRQVTKEKVAEKLAELLHYSGSKELSERPSLNEFQGCLKDIIAEIR